MSWRLTWNANCLSHLTIHRWLGTVLVATVLIGSACSLLVSLALRFLLLLLGLPLLSDFFEFYYG